MAAFGHICGRGYTQPPTNRRGVRATLRARMPAAGAAGGLSEISACLGPRPSRICVTRYALKPNLHCLAGPTRALSSTAMAQPHKVAAMISEGLTPAQVAGQLQVSHATVLGYLDRAVGEGLLKRSDIYFTLSPESRESSSTREDREVVNRFGGAVLGDMYEHLREIETTLHKRIRLALERQYGSEENEWWAQGVPQNVRTDCQTLRERDPDRLHPYCYTNLIHLLEILEQNWNVLQTEVGQLASNRKEMRQQFLKLNRIRNIVMHPTRGQLSVEGDFLFIRNLRKDLQL